MRFVAQLLEMGTQIESTVDPVDDVVLVVFKMKAEDARKLGPLLYQNLGIDVVLRKVGE